MLSHFPRPQTSISLQSTTSIARSALPAGAFDGMDARRFSRSG